MLAMDQIYNIRFQAIRKGKSLRSIARETGHDFATVKKYVEKDDFNEIKERRQRKSKLEPYKYLIDQWLKDDLKAKPKQRHTAQRVYDRLKEKFGTQFNISDRTVRSYVAKMKAELYGHQEGYLPLEHLPGQAQVDFGQAEFIENGVKFTGHYLNLSFPYSNSGYTQVFKGENIECLLMGLKSIFEHIGSVPNCIWFDNMACAVIAVKKFGERDLKEMFKRFALHYGFECSFCNPNSGHEKGSVESKVGYHRRNFFVPIPQFKDIKEYNRQLLELADGIRQRKHYKKEKTIAELFLEDKEAMLKLPKKEFEIFKLEKAKADNYGKVKFDNHIYSTSPEYAKKEVWIKADAFNLVILDQDYRYIQSHIRLYGSQKESMNWLPYIKLMAKRPAALKYTGFFQQMPQTLQDYFQSCAYQQKKAALQVLEKMVALSDIQTATSAFETTLKIGLADLDSIWATYYALTNEVPAAIDMKLDNKIPEIKSYKIDISSYDNLLKGGDK